MGQTPRMITMKMITWVWVKLMKKNIGFDLNWLKKSPSGYGCKREMHRMATNAQIRSRRSPSLANRPTRKKISSLLGSRGMGLNAAGDTGNNDSVGVGSTMPC